MTEREFQRMVLDLAKLYGWRRVHFRPCRTKGGWRTPCQGDAKGWVDAVLVRPGVGDRRGRTLFVELKSDAGTLTPEQAEWQWVLLAAGNDYRCWRPRDWPDIERTLKGD